VPNTLKLMQEAGKELEGQDRVEIKPITGAGFVKEVLHGIGLVFGLGLLWSLEMVRNGFFRLLDRFGVKARRRRKASAFPPGPLPRRGTVRARR
jgi:hypothetical protein